MCGSVLSMLSTDNKNMYMCIQYDIFWTYNLIENMQTGQSACDFFFRLTDISNVLHETVHSKLKPVLNLAIDT